MPPRQHAWRADSAVVVGPHPPCPACFTHTAVAGPAADWLEERAESVYKQHPGYSEKATNLFTLDLGAPEELPDALRGEKWSIVQLPLATLQQVSRSGWLLV